jgi:prepilin-type N-terminal cleavage/methylation domain-containing protein
MAIQKNSGFTLLELIVVIIVLAIIAAAIYIKSTDTSVDLTAQVSQVADDIRYTQSLSMSKNQHYRLIITLPSSYTIQDASGNTVSSTTLDNGTTFSSAFTIIFNSKGTPYSNDSTPLASTATITLTYSTGQTGSVTITPITGRVTP